MIESILYFRPIDAFAIGRFIKTMLRYAFDWESSQFK